MRLKSFASIIFVMPLVVCPPWAKPQCPSRKAARPLGSQPLDHWQIFTRHRSCSKHLQAKILRPLNPRHSPDSYIWIFLGPTVPPSHCSSTPSQGPLSVFGLGALDQGLLGLGHLLVGLARSIPYAPREFPTVLRLRFCHCHDNSNGTRIISNCSIRHPNVFTF